MAEYFSHDYNARCDPKIVLLRIKMGYEGVGIFWSLLEYLYDQNGYLMRSQYECIADELHTQCDKIKMVVEEFKLFEYDDEKFWSKSALDRLKFRSEKSEKAANSAKIRWFNANAMRTQCERNAIKESKEKESKEKESKEKENKEKENKDVTPCSVTETLPSASASVSASASASGIQERGMGETKTSQDIDKNLPEFKLSKIFWKQVSESGTAQKKPDFNSWSEEFEKIHRIDNRPWDWIRQLIISALSDPFWKKNIRSPSKLRKQINDGKLDQFIPDEWMSDEEVIENISNPSNKHTETPQESTISNEGVPE
jgi:hypothetical protein